MIPSPFERLDIAFAAYRDACKDRRKCTDYCTINHDAAITKALTELVDALLEALADRITEKR